MILMQVKNSTNVHDKMRCKLYKKHAG